MDSKQQAIHTNTSNKSTKINGVVYFTNILVNGHVIPVYKNTSEHDIIQGCYTCLFGAYSIPWKSIYKTKLDLHEIEEELKELYNLHKNLQKKKDLI